MIDFRPFMNLRNGPKYIALSEGIDAACRAGDLKAGMKLPTHRELAKQLKVSVQTVSRAYAYAEHQGILYGRKGSGTYVGHYSPDQETAFLENIIEVNRSVIDLSIAKPICSEKQLNKFKSTMLEVINESNLDCMNRFRPVSGLSNHISSAKEWLNIQGAPVTNKNLILTNGTSQSIFLALASIIRPGELVACEKLVDHGLIGLSKTLNFKLLGLSMDEEGILPDALEKACQETQLRVLCCTPTFNNPTSSLMGISRREQIAYIAEKYRLIVIEDDVFGALQPNRYAPVSSYIPEQSFYASSLSKISIPGLRAGFLLVPENYRQQTLGHLAASGWMATPLTFEVASHMIHSGELLNLVNFQRREFSVRQTLARSILPGKYCHGSPYGMHIWLQLPEHLTAKTLSDRLAGEGIKVSTADQFIVNYQESINFLRISLGAEAERERLLTGLNAINSLLNNY